MNGRQFPGIFQLELAMRRFIQTILILSVVSLSAAITARAQTKEFRIDNVAPMTFIETKASGEKIKRSGVQAIVAAWPRVSSDEMNTFAENLLNLKLREIADRDKNELIFITFYLEKIPSGGKDGWKTFRVIYTRETTGWKRLQNEAKVEGADAGRQHVTAAPGSNDRPGYLSTEFLREQAARSKVRAESASREASPLEWGDAQHNLGLALWALAEREDSKAHLQSSIAALRNAATVRTRERDAPRWALTQWALGKAMADLAKQEQEEERSIAAIEVYRAVEREKPRLLELTVGKEGLAMPRALLSLGWTLRPSSNGASMPLDWRRFYYDLGDALLTLGSKESDKTHLEEALAIFKQVPNEGSTSNDPSLLQKARDGAEQAETLLAKRAIQ